MLTQIILFVMIYTAIGTLVAGYIIPKREWDDTEQITDFIVTMVSAWWLQLCVSTAFWLATFFHEDEDG